MENTGAQDNKNNNHDQSLSTGTDGTSQLILDVEEYDMDALLTDDANASTNNAARGSKGNHPAASVAAPKHHKRHDIQQIQELEAFFKTCAHPDEMARKALGAKIGMESLQVKHWFQNRRSQIKNKSCSHENDQLRTENDALKVQNAYLRTKLKERTCLPCLCLTAAATPSELLSEKQRLLNENARLKEELQRAQATIAELSRGAPFPLAVAMPPSVVPLAVAAQQDQERVTLLLQHGEHAMNELLVLAAAGEPMWWPCADGEELNFPEYVSRVSPRMTAPCPNGFVSEGTRDTEVIWCSAADLVGILTDANRWSEMFSPIVGAVTFRDVVGSTTTSLGSRNGLIQLVNAELRVQSARMLNRRVKFLRYTKMLLSNRHWAVVDVSVDGILADGGGAHQPRAGSKLILPSGCLIEELDNGCCKVIWIVHAEYAEAAVPPPFRSLFRSGQAFGARHWLLTLRRMCEFMSVMKGFPANDPRKGLMEVARRMTASFHGVISGPSTLPGSIPSEWRGSVGTGQETFQAAVRMVVWNCGSVPSDQPVGVGQAPPLQHQSLAACTTVWLPATEPQLVLDYLRDNRRRGEWDLLAGGADVNELGTIITGNNLGNAVSLLSLRPHVPDGINNRIQVLQEVCSDKSFSMVVYSIMAEKTMATMTAHGARDPSFLLPSGFAIIPDGNRQASQQAPSTSSTAQSSSSSSSNAPPPAGGHYPTKGCFLTAALQTLLPNPLTENIAVNAFDVIGKQVCHMLEKIKAAVGADSIVPI